VQWDYCDIDGKCVGMYENGLLDESYKRHSMEYHLIIRHAAAEDAGYYSCVENAGSGRESVKYHLIYEGVLLHHIVTEDSCRIITALPLYF